MHPLGGLARKVGYVEAMKKAGIATLVLDTGDLLAKDAALAVSVIPQERLKARILQRGFEKTGCAGIALGEKDVQLMGEVKMPCPWLAANARAKDRPIEHSRLIEIAGVKVGIVGLAPTPPKQGGPPYPPPPPDAAWWSQRGITLQSTQKSAQGEIDALRAQGAELVIVLAHLPIQSAHALAAKLHGVDLIASGHDDFPTWEAQPTPGGAAVVGAGDRGRMFVRLDVRVPATNPKHAPLALLKAPNPQNDTFLTTQVATLEKFLADAGAPTFPGLSRRNAELQIQGYRKQLADAHAGTIAPAGAPAAMMRLINVDATLPEDPEIVDLVDQLNVQLKKVNAAAPTSPALDLGPNRYAGIQRCKTCHSAAFEMWKRTPHARAYATLAKDHRESNLDCVGCHVTGWMLPGGVGGVQRFQAPKNRAIPDLRDVQCEACHGPLLAHANNPAIVKASSHVNTVVCLGCHTPQQTDGFDPATFVPRITGPGHVLRSPLPPPRPGGPKPRLPGAVPGQPAREMLLQNQ